MTRPQSPQVAAMPAVESQPDTYTTLIVNVLVNRRNRLEASDVAKREKASLLELSSAQQSAAQSWRLAKDEVTEELTRCEDGRPHSLLLPILSSCTTDQNVLDRIQYITRALQANVALNQATRVSKSEEATLAQSRRTVEGETGDIWLRYEQLVDKFSVATKAANEQMQGNQVALDQCKERLKASLAKMAMLDPLIVRDVLDLVLEWNRNR
ncbi:hypothetical protein JCM16303_004981 [Sporobolomyces ruberrimus]